MLFTVLRKVTFSKLLFEIDNAEYVDRLPVKLHDEFVVEAREIDDIDLLVVGTRHARGRKD